MSAVEPAIRERTGRLTAFRGESFTHARAVDVDAASGTLLVFFNHVSGIRLSSLLAAAEKRSIAPDLNAVRCLLRQLVHAMAAWRDALPDASHGALGPERIVITPSGRLVVAEAVLGAVVEQIRYSRDKYWSELRVPLPPPPSAPPAFDARTDVAQIGLVALALVLGRRLTNDVYPSGLTHALTSASLRSGIGPLEPLSFAFRDWMRRAMQLDPRESFPTALEVGAALDEAIGEENEALERDALHVFLARCLALDLHEGTDMSSTPGVTELDPDKIELITDDVSTEVDLGPRIEALRAFLARYPAQTSAEPGAVGDLAVDLSSPSHTDIAPADAPAAASLNPEPLDARLRTATEPISVSEPLIVTAIGTAPSVGVGLADASVVDDAVTRRSAAPVPGVWSNRLWVAGGIALAVVVTIGMLLASRYFRSSPASNQGTLSITTTPSGIPVIVDGLRKGVTPLGIELAPGEHLVELLTERGRRQFPVTIKPGSQVSQVVELSPSAPPIVTGELQIRTDPAAASVTVDGRFVGRSPVSVADLAPGAHTVVLSHESGTVTERVVIEAGRTASLLVPMGSRAAESSAAGWITVAAPADVQVFEGDRLLGNNRIERIMLPVGRHDLDIVNESLGYRERRTVQVTPGRVAAIQAQWPTGTLALNAVPWAEVFVDGNPVGETPIGSLKVPIGVHEVVFRHPQLGERRTTVTVPTGAPTKVGIDLRAK